MSLEKKGIIIYESVPKSNSTLENVPTVAKRIDLKNIEDKIS